MKLSVILANNLLCLRQRMDIAQETLAEMCNISTQEVSKIENARANTCIGILQKLCDGLNVDASTLFCNTESSTAHGCGECSVSGDLANKHVSVYYTLTQNFPRTNKYERRSKSMKEFSLISTDCAPFEGTVRYGILCKGTDNITKINDISERKELVEAIILLDNAKSPSL